MAHDNWEAEDAVRTLVRAEEIKKDKKLMKKVKVEMKRQQKATAAAAESIGQKVMAGKS